MSSSLRYTMFRSIFVISKVSLKQLVYRELLVEFGMDQTLGRRDKHIRT